MKKHISIAFLFVAGTSFASAGTASFTFNSPIEGATSITVNGGSKETITGSLESVVSGATFALSQGGVAGWGTVKGDIISPYNSSYSKWNNDVALSEISSDSGISVDALKGITQGIGDFSEPSGNPQVVMLSGLDANTEYAITSIWGPLSASWKLDFTQGSFVEGYYGCLWMDQINGVEWEKFEELSGPSSGFSIYGIKTIVRSDDTGSISFTGTVNSEIAFLSVSTIPEPSEFGLIAGIGAIVLSVSRRRR